MTHCELSLTTSEQLYYDIPLDMFLESLPHLIKIGVMCLKSVGTF